MKGVGGSGNEEREVKNANIPTAAAMIERQAPLRLSEYERLTKVKLWLIIATIIN